MKRKPNRRTSGGKKEGTLIFMKKAVALIMSFALLFLSVTFIEPASVVRAATQQELEDKIDRLNGEIDSNREKISELESKKEKNEAYLETLETQITAVQEKANAIEAQIKDIDKEIAAYDKQLDKLAASIKKTRKKIKENQASVDEAKGELSALMKNSYVNGKQTTLELFMGAKDLASFLTHLEMMKRTSENEKRIIDDFTAKIEKLKASKNELSKTQAEVSATKQKSVEKKTELETKQAEYKATSTQLSANKAKVQSLLDEIDQSSALYQSYIKKLNSEKQAADAEIAEIIRQRAQTNPTPQPTQADNSNSESNGNSSNASWGFPAASGYISSGYGNRDASISGWSYHGGIDITGGGYYGTPIYATRAGTVIAANYGTTGYGNYVVIDHGDGYTSLYGHCSSLAVSTGQSVSKGQHIANAGDSGNVTGPHLHFEIRYNGEKQNPLNYIG